ncbi:MAG: GTP cyclohydrolase I FolE [Pseudomonadota bacterium]|jgi:GTP cyclohydrolase I|nr:GTP cyclohydrolase I FolE [Porticoccaceae bacterium]MCH2560384.1 GTP cyclohydrolase I FolE [Pseudomonadales bacterium]MEC7157861.1 GTP cyclohydrolase I FolE [Pseudomonadota bacterium]MAL67662.1 GTP cyclohydrolase I FolE [Porticoccaceae bacterium]MBR87963.1 GTP cyclohydrolase I FolE [Porticoccaceae bacterium]|tara:strand:- start:571 stop:1266 length:696 start_codon:yes stop_codon:yes gene_type:complete
MPSTAIARSDTDFQSNLSLEAQLVRNALIEKGLETPMSGIKLSRDEKYTRIRDAMTQVATALGLDLKDDSLQETPHRIAKMYVDEIFSGLNYESFPKISLIKNKMNTEEMIKVKAVKVISTCEHHFVTIDGLANVAYLPGKKIIGLSKINRIVSFFAQRPQVQERLTQQILVALQTLLDTRDVAVFIDATHYCVKARGIMDASSRTETSALGGLFKSDQSLRDNFLNNQRR